MPPGECPGVASTWSDLPPTRMTWPSEEIGIGAAVRVDGVPQHPVGRMRATPALRGPRPAATGRVDVVVVAVGGDDGHGAPAGDGLDDGPVVVGGVDHHDLAVVADDPDVVLDLEVCAVEGERCPT